MDWFADEHQALGQFRKMRINCIGERQVRHGAALIDGHFMGILVHHTDQKVSSVLRGGFCSGLAFEELGNHIVFVPPTIVPGAGECDLSRHRLP